jgi:hypothetical protein
MTELIISEDLRACNANVRHSGPAVFTAEAYLHGLKESLDDRTLAAKIIGRPT